VNDIVPIIDIASFVTGSAGSSQVVEKVRQACERVGFFIITEHGVDEQVIRRMYARSRAFFDLPLGEKTRVRTTGDQAGGLAYVPLSSESLAATRGEPQPGDLKEALDFGPGFMGDTWPTNPSGLRAAWMDYYAAMGRLARVLRGIFACAIGVQEHHFEAEFARHHSSLRVINYPDQAADPQPGQLRAGAHTDYGFLTVLRSEDSPGGLQVQVRDGGWTDVRAVPGAFIVNLGDALMRMTNDRWVSTPHRVVNPPRVRTSGTRRQSMAFFHNPNPDAVVRCLDAFCGPGYPPKYEPIKYADYAALKYYQSRGEKLVQVR
jgi:isopenicillin N synthase-like dioxygenase